jgi:DNA repair photolyase
VCEHAFVRWDQLTVEEQERRALPGFRDGAVVRTFDAPEALDTRFYEVRARSALNRVPERSRMPFRWTINPYRGCTHACTYCLGPETPVLLGDGTTRQIADLRPGDYVYGTVRRGRYRRYAVTQVLDHWSTIKPAYRVTLEDGTELVASGDHRLLTSRGWKHVTGAEQGRGRRPHLTLNDRLIGTGRFATRPEDWPDYRRGYLCGLIRGDGSLTSYERVTAEGGRRRLHRFRLALTDREALERAKHYLETERGIVSQEFAFPTLGRRSMRAIRTQRRDDFAAITELVEWPRGQRTEWCKGFLAGIFDAEGSFSGRIRISNTDPQIVDWIAWSLRALGFPFVVEDHGRPNGLRRVRLLGGLRTNLRFLHTVDPAIARKRDIEGRAVKSPSPAHLRVASIEPLGRGHRLYDITTGTGDFIANGVVSHNCFARPTHAYLDMNAREDFEREIVVKVNVPELLRAELARPSWRGEHVALGTNTDPYQWVEGRYRLMPGIWEAFRDFANPCSVLTKSPLVLRDKELLQEVAARAPVTASFSVPTLDERAWRATEPHTPHPRKRLEAVAELNEAGIPTGILIAPLMPGVNDRPEQVREIVEIATDAGAVSIGGIALHLRGEVREIFFDWLRAHRPDLVPLYEETYRRGAYAPKDVQERMRALARPTRTLASRGRHLGDTGHGRGPAARPPREREEAAAQPALF